MNVQPLASCAEGAGFRNALAKLASGVAVVACWSDGAPRGLLVSSITGLSTEPPRLLFCVRKAAVAHDAILRAETVGISLLHRDDREEAQRFSTPGRAPERFSADRWLLEAAAPPTRRDALAVFVGRIFSRIEADSHTVFIVDALTADIGAADPLVYFEREFRDLV